MLALSLAQAQSNLTLTSAQAFMFYLVGGLVAIVFFASVVVNIWDRVRRKPTIEDTFASKKELADARVDRDAIRVELKALDERTDRKIEALDRRREVGEKENRDLLHREVTNIKDFIADKISENRENNTERFGVIFGKLDSFQVSMQGLSNDVMHQVGRLEGQMEHVKKAA